MSRAVARIRPGSVRLKRGAMRDAGFGGTTPYAAADTGIDTLSGFLPSNSAADAEVLPGRDRITARARDLVRNNGWAAGAAAKEVDSIIGANFRPIFKPDWRALGLDADWANEFKEALQARWRLYADDPRKMADTTRSQSVSQMFGLGYRTYSIEGEALALVNWRRARLFRTTLRIVDPDLLSNPMDMPDAQRLRGGIEISRDGIAQAYHFRQQHADPGMVPDGDDAWKWKRIARETPRGRPQVLHFFDKQRDGQTRGVSRYAPIIEKLRMEDHYSKVELQAAVLNAVLAAYIQSPMGPGMIDEMFGGGDTSAVLNMNADRRDYYDDQSVRIGGVRLSTLYPNDEIGMVQTARPAAQFGDFESAVLRNIASGLGISYEQLASDWSKTNYSSARAALIEIWRSWTSRRTAFAQGFCQPFVMAWVEEQIMDGHLPLPSNAPDFYTHWTAYSRAKWIGPGKGFVDPVKEAQAAAMRVALGLSTLEEEAAELTGSDHGENMEQITREIGTMPEGVLHPAQESFAKLIGPATAAPDDSRP